MTTEATGIINQSFERRSADYKPNIWNYDLLQSLQCEFHEEEYRLQVQKAREEVKAYLLRQWNLWRKHNFSCIPFHNFLTQEYN
ncbi:hypothetical protein LXL04_010112 [Taraxacum kok-saghyz]